MTKPAARRPLTLGAVIDARHAADARDIAREAKVATKERLAGARHEARRCASLLRSAIELDLGVDTVRGYAADLVVARLALSEALDAFEGAGYTLSRAILADVAAATRASNASTEYLESVRRDAAGAFPILDEDEIALPEPGAAALADARYRRALEDMSDEERAAEAAAELENAADYAASHNDAVARAEEDLARARATGDSLAAWNAAAALRWALDA